MNTRRVLILTAGYGEGHNSAARALKSALDEIPGCEAELVDVFALCAPRLNAISRRAYLRLINAAPSIWSAFYGWLDRSPRAPILFGTLGIYQKRLAQIIAEKKPSALISTYPVYPWLLENLRRKGQPIPPSYTVITDAITINSLWYKAPAAHWFVADQHSANFLLTKGLPPEKITVSGFPVALAFADRPAALFPPEPSPSHRWRVLYMINSSRSRALATAGELLKNHHWRITFTAGRDEVLKEKLKEMIRSHRADSEVLGWTDRIPQLLMTHHVIISKAGGATTQESINALCPMIVNQIIPGQEEGNWQLLQRHNAGAHAESPAKIVEALENAFANNGTIWKSWRTNLRRIAHPAAARTIATKVLRDTHTPAPTNGNAAEKIPERI